MDRASVVTGWVEWLLDLEHIRLGQDAPLSVHWQMGLPLWLVVPLAALAAASVGLIYRRERGSRPRRVSLAGVRVLLIGLVAAMLCGPVLRLQRNRREPSQVALLVDRSRSMRLRDAVERGSRGEAGGDAVGVGAREVGGGASRIERVRRALLRDDGAGIRALLSKNELEIYTFGRSVVREAAIGGVKQASTAVGVLKGLECEATMTNVPRAILEVLKRREGGRLAAIVLASDGRSTEAGSLAEAIAAARAQKVPVFAIPVGSSRPRRDVSVGAVAAAERLFLKDLVSLAVPVEGTGLEAATEVTVRLVDADGETVVAETKDILAADGALREIELRFQPERAGVLDYRVEVLPIEGEVTTDNNAARLRMEVLDVALRVLYVDGYPRYEYRYLKNALLREPTIRSSCLLLSADAGFAQEGTDPIRRFPETMEELSAYDVVLLGDVDVRGEWLSATQAEMLAAYVAERGGGVGFIAGTRHVPQGLRGTPLEKLLPVRIDPEFTGRFAGVLDKSFRPVLTPEGRRSRLFRFLGDDDPGSLLGGLFWMARTLGANPGAEVLAVRSDWRVGGPMAKGVRGGGGESEMAGAFGGEEMPLVVVGRYGAGRVLFVGTDETWRWRRSGGEWVFDTFWLQVCRALMKPGSVGRDRRVVLSTDRRRYRFGERVEVRAEVLDGELLAGLQHETHALVLDGEDRPAGRVTLTRVGAGGRRFEGSFVPARAGSYALELEDAPPGVGTRRASTTIRVAEADLELREPRADHASLRRLAEETGGAVMRPETIVETAQRIQDRSVQIPDDTSEPLWDSRLALMAFTVLIVTEWVLRKAFGMV